MIVAFVTTDWERVKDEDCDRPLHEAACAKTGIELAHPAWWDPDVDWRAFDLVVIRSPWDYSERLDEFLCWLDRVDGHVPLHNPASVIRWNLDKHYLADLRESGVPVIQTIYLDHESEVEAALVAAAGREIVVKPTVSAGSRHTGRFRGDDPKALELAQTILAEGKVVMLQPCAASVAQEGEVSLVYFDGRLSHSFRKGPLLASGGGLLGGSYQEEITAAPPTPEQRAVADQVSAAAGEICRERFGVSQPLLYARYDIIRLDDGSEALLEAELFEPSFFLQTDSEAAGRFAAALRDRVLRQRTL